MPNVNANLNCSRRLVIYAVFDVLDKMGGEYEQTMRGDIRAEVKVLAHTSEYAFAVTEQNTDHSILHVSILRPAKDMTEQDKWLAVRYMADSILLHIDEVQALEQQGE